MIEPIFDKDSNNWYFSCPNCKSLISVNNNEINCTIFRHAVYKSTGEPINPHACKDEIDNLNAKNLIYGCGQPFIFKLNPKPEIYMCDYV